MTTNIGIIIGMTIIAFVLSYLSVEIEETPIKVIAFIFSMLFIISGIAVMAVGLTSTAAVTMAYSTMSITIMLTIFIIFYYMLNIVKDIIESTQTK